MLLLEKKERMELTNNQSPIRARSTIITVPPTANRNMQIIRHMQIIFLDVFEGSTDFCLGFREDDDSLVLVSD
jgi:hypothetical protein